VNGNRVLPAWGHEEFPRGPAGAGSVRYGHGRSRGCEFLPKKNRHRSNTPAATLQSRYNPSTNLEQRVGAHRVNPLPVPVRRTDSEEGPTRRGGFALTVSESGFVGRLAPLVAGKCGGGPAADPRTVDRLPPSSPRRTEGRGPGQQDPGSTREPRPPASPAPGVRNVAKHFLTPSPCCGDWPVQNLSDRAINAVLSWFLVSTAGPGEPFNHPAKNEKTGRGDHGKRAAAGLGSTSSDRCPSNRDARLLVFVGDGERDRSPTAHSRNGKKHVDCRWTTAE